LSFVPLYRFLGPVTMIIILVLFFVSISRLLFTILFRAIVRGRHKGCGFWIFAAFLGCAYQVIISPIQWADRKAQEIADKVEQGMIEGAEKEAKEDREVKEVPGGPQHLPQPHQAAQERVSVLFLEVSLQEGGRC
jgi:hypothetical protein